MHQSPRRRKGRPRGDEWTGPEQPSAHVREDHSPDQSDPRVVLVWDGSVVSLFHNPVEDGRDVVPSSSPNNAEYSLQTVFQQLNLSFGEIMLGKWSTDLPPQWILDTHTETYLQCEKAEENCAHTESILHNLCATYFLQLPCLFVEKLKCQWMVWICVDLLRKSRNLFLQLSADNECRHSNTETIG